MRDIQSMIDSVDELIAKNAEQLRLLRQMREVFVLAQRAGVDPREIERTGFDPMLANKQTRREIDRGATPQTNYVILRDGRKVPLS